ncbi:MAG: serine protease [Minisyncoccia bacterium]
MVRIFFLFTLSFLVYVLSAPIISDTPEIAFVREIETHLPLATTSPIATTSAIVEETAEVVAPVVEKLVAPEPEPEAPQPAGRPDPYPFPQKTFAVLNTEAREALVNIICSPEGGRMDPISGSGVLIDPRGVILTNSHVAQFILLASRKEINLSCVVRTGSPARGSWTVNILYMPTAWIDQHAQDIQKTHPLGTGEHDYTFLVITGAKDGASLPSSFPFLSLETRSIHVPGDTIFLAAYPAEFSGGSEIQNLLYASTTVTTIKQLMTFSKSTIDVIAIGGVVLAQSGSSGGSALNAWGRLIGLISTTSGGDTTAERNLRAISIPYINRALQESNGTNIEELLSGDVAAKALFFMQEKSPALAERLISYIKK